MAGMLEALGRTCCELRMARGVMQARIAARAGVTDSVISRFEKGERWPRRFERIVDAYAEECGVDGADLWIKAAWSLKREQPPEGG